jgi:hypothetical protein
MDFGPMLAARHLWRELSLEATLDRLVRRSRGDTAPPLSDRALVLVANRLTAPGSEHGLARWLETDFVCDRDGRRWVPAWRDDTKRLSSKTPRVRVEMRQLKQWYRALDQLLAHKSEIEHALYLTLWGREIVKRPPKGAHIAESLDDSDPYSGHRRSYSRCSG